MQSRAISVGCPSHCVCVCVLLPVAAAVLQTTSDALSPADQDTLASMLKASEGVELVGENGSSLDEELSAEEEALENAAAGTSALVAARQVQGE